MNQSKQQRRYDGPIWVFFVLAYLFSWLIALPLVLKRQGVWDPGIPWALHYCIALGPMLSAIVVTAWCTGRKGLSELFGRVFQWRVGWVWWLVGLGSPVLLFLLAAVVVRLHSGHWPHFARLGEIEFLPYIGITGAWLLWVISYGFGEEIGWRGFALPRLQAHMGALPATLLLGLGWALWHLPFFFYKRSFMAMSGGGIVGYVVGMMFGALVLTWLYNSSRGSILIVALWHGTFNLGTGSVISSGSIAAIMSTVVMVAAVVVLFVYGPESLSHQPKALPPQALTEPEETPPMSHGIINAPKI